MTVLAEIERIAPNTENWPISRAKIKNFPGDTRNFIEIYVKNGMIPSIKVPTGIGLNESWILSKDGLDVLIEVLTEIRKQIGND